MRGFRTGLWIASGIRFALSCRLGSIAPFDKLAREAAGGMVALRAQCVVRPFRSANGTRVRVSFHFLSHHFPFFLGSIFLFFVFFYCVFCGITVRVGSGFVIR